MGLIDSPCSTAEADPEQDSYAAVGMLDGQSYVATPVCSDLPGP